MANLARAVALFMLAAYRTTLSPFTGCTCRFTPSCSVYAQAAFRRHHPWHALRLTLTRLARCHPLGGRGYDPVPERTSI